jgi:hypothetical protein
MRQQTLELRASCLRRYVGLRVNLFRAMHDGRFFVADDLTVLATRIGEHALTACVAFDSAFSCHYVVECRWYASDLTQLADEDVPSGIRAELLHQFVTVLG